MYDSRTAPLTADDAVRLADFARACKAAARAVSLYPARHPAIAASLERLAGVTASLTAHGPYRLQVSAGTLLVDGGAPARPDPAVTELAELLHRHLIGRLTLNPGADADSWRTLFLLLARTPEDVRADGGIAALWATAGGPSIEIEEVDYAEILREKGGTAAAVEQVIAAALDGTRLELDDSGARLLLEMVQDPARLQQLVAEIQAHAAQHGADLQAAAFLTLVRQLTDWLSQHEPRGVDAMWTRMGAAAGQLSAEAMLKLLGARTRGDAPTREIAGAVIARMEAPATAHFVASSVIRERGATERLAEAFSALVPDVEQQRRVLGLAHQEVLASEGGGESTAELWQRVEGMLLSYSDDAYVSDQYARELSAARSRATAVEETGQDPPERIAGWLSTVTDAALRGQDQQLLADLLRIESDLLRWRDIAETASARGEDLIRVGYVEQGCALVQTILREGAREPGREPYAASALAPLGRSASMKPLWAHVREAGDDVFETFKALCRAAGPSAVPSLAEVLSGEQDLRARRRLRDVIIGFGPPGRDAIRQLMDAPGWEIRRTAAYLLREFGGADALRELLPLLTDKEPLVRREAVEALVMNGSDEASRMLLQALASASGRPRQALLDQLTAMRDERAAPLFCYLLRHMDRRAFPRLYFSAVDALGGVGSADAIAALKHALYDGDWRAPIRTHRIRRAAAGALRRIGTPAALDALREASAHGSLGVRAAARSQVGRAL